MSDSAASNSVDEFDYHLSSLTVGQFCEEVETVRQEVDGVEVATRSRQLQMITCQSRYGFTQGFTPIWNASVGRNMPDDMKFEEFLDSQIIADNKVRRGDRRRSGSPVRHNGAFIVQAIVTDQAMKTLMIEYKPALDFVFKYNRRG